MRRFLVIVYFRGDGFRLCPLRKHLRKRSNFNIYSDELVLKINMYSKTLLMLDSPG